VGVQIDDHSLPAVNPLRVTAAGQDDSPRRVAVVGAGLAGLAAATALARGGCEVVVLEARDRVGGRVWSRELDDGSVVEMGAEFILPGNTVVEATAMRLGLGLWAKGMAYGRREPRGVPLGEDELRAAAAFIAAALADPAVAAGTAAELLGQLDEPVREAVRARVEVSCATAAEDVGADELAGVAAISDAPSFGIAGGNQGLARALAAPLDVRLRTPVSGIAWGSPGVVLRAAGGEIAADAVVVAVPAPLVATITFSPALPLAAAVASVRYGHAAKLFVPLAARPEPSAVLSVRERYWTWTARAGAAVQPVVHAFAGSPAALERLGVDAGPERWLASLARLRDDLPLRAEGALLSTWSDDPWARGAYSVHRPGGNDPALAEPCGPVVLAGEYTAGPYAGLMEGALRSGLRAAAQFLSGAS
jgi:monoamine oxidase